ncbi:hypothetical protein GQX74_003602 [Glossina fuscipes]|uniref:Uncharacterized protein n=1 Tax=Glossina palpalis gambiensis TaxID=67801 RepID=A0A1B0ANK4_9MUSC|nr:hypothetical protein GQX74_003602 [Glossina fuscipes]
MHNHRDRPTTKDYSKSSMITASEELSKPIDDMSGAILSDVAIFGVSLFSLLALFPNSCIFIISIPNTWAGSVVCNTCSNRAGCPQTTNAFAKCSTPLSKSPRAISVSPNWISCKKYLK